MQGITGVLLVDLDFFDPATSPAPKLSFPPVDPYLLAQPSLLTELEDPLRAAVRRLPAITEHTVATLAKLERMLDEVSAQQLGPRLGRVVDDLGDAVARFRRLAQRNGDRLTSVLDKLDGEEGLVASARRATDSLGELGRNTAGATVSLEQTLHDLDDAAQAVRAFFDTLEREPDMLVKGRSTKAGRQERQR